MGYEEISLKRKKNKYLRGNINKTEMINKLTIIKLRPSIFCLFNKQHKESEKL